MAQIPEGTFDGKGIGKMDSFEVVPAGDYLMEMLESEFKENSNE